MDVQPEAGAPATARVLVLGGARSGKSTFAESFAARFASVDYVATADRYPDDPEWVARVALHQQRRPAHWRTIETFNVADELRRSTDSAVLVDCLTLWLTRQMDVAGVWDDAPGCDAALQRATDELVAAFEQTRRPVIAVSNEVGQGVVPASPAGRRFRDEMGILNTRIAQISTEVHFFVAGIPVRIK